MEVEPSKTRRSVSPAGGLLNEAAPRTYDALILQTVGAGRMGRSD